MKTILLGLASIALLCAIPASAAGRGGGIGGSMGRMPRAGGMSPGTNPTKVYGLDGKSYTVVVKLPDGKHVEDTYSFKGDTIESALGVSQGYAPARFTGRRESGMTIITAKMKNEKGDIRTVRATIEGYRMRGNVEIREAGKTEKLKFVPKSSWTDKEKMAEKSTTK